MARTRKTPKPKLPTHERIDPKSDPHEVYLLLKKLVKEFRPDLADAKIAVAWRYGWKKNKDGQLVLGKCKKAGDLDKQFHDQDFVIILNFEAWTIHLTPTQRTALMHHELEHAATSEDQNGNPKFDARGRRMYRVRKHDLEEFQAIVKEYGCYKSDIESFVRAAIDSPKPPAPTLFDAMKAAAPEMEKQLQDRMDEVAPGTKVEIKFNDNGQTPAPSANGHVGDHSQPQPSLNGHAYAELNGRPRMNGKPHAAPKNRIASKLNPKDKGKSKAKAKAK